jgi:uncharacterized membrane protein (UPF0127 family)
MKSKYEDKDAASNVFIIPTQRINKEYFKHMPVCLCIIYIENMEIVWR